MSRTPLTERFEKVGAPVLEPEYEYEANLTFTEDGKVVIKVLIRHPESTFIAGTGINEMPYSSEIGVWHFVVAASRAYRQAFPEKALTREAKELLYGAQSS